MREREEAKGAGLAPASKHTQETQAHGWTDRATRHGRVTAESGDRKRQPPLGREAEGRLGRAAETTQLNR